MLEGRPAKAKSKIVYIKHVCYNYPKFCFNEKRHKSGS
jgi:hypothetical protein